MVQAGERTPEKVGLQEACSLARPGMNGAYAEKAAARLVPGDRVPDYKLAEGRRGLGNQPSATECLSPPPAPPLALLTVWAAGRRGITTQGKGPGKRSQLPPAMSFQHPLLTKLNMVTV